MQQTSSQTAREKNRQRVESKRKERQSEKRTKDSHNESERLSNKHGKTQIKIATMIQSETKTRQTHIKNTDVKKKESD